MTAIAAGWREWAWGRKGTRKAIAGAKMAAPTYARGAPVAARARALLRDEAPAEDLAGAAAAIVNAEWGWDEWNKVMMACWASSEGSAEGLAAAHAISAKSKKYRPEDVEERWAHYFRSPPSDIGFGTLVYLARLAVPGWEPPSRAPRRFEPAGSTSDRPVTASNINGEHASPQLLPPSPPNNPLIELNSRYACIGDVGGKCRIMSWVASKIDRNVAVPVFQSPKDFSDRYANQYVVVNNERKAIGSYWLRWPGRNSFEGIDLQPGGKVLLPGNVLNLWRGLAVTPCRGEWPLMRAHICEVLANGDAEAARYILRFAAWAVQHPGEPAEAALVLRGGQGAGKGAFANAMVRIFGAHGLHVYSPKHLVGAFNAHLRECVLLFADEAFWAGDRQGESTLKGMLTEPTLVIEAKGMNAVAWPNCLHVIMAANAEWIVPAAHDARRYAVFNVSEGKTGRRDYFNALYHETEHGGLAAMLFDLLAVDLGSWHPRDIPNTAALREQKEWSMDWREEWWERRLQEGKLPFFDKSAPDICRALHLFDQASENTNYRLNVSPKGLSMFLRRIGAIRHHTRAGTVWKFPNLAKCRSEWEKWMRGWKWDSDLLNEWRNDF